MKYIKLRTQGKFAIVDDEDYEWLMQYKWYAQENKYTWYACRYITIAGKSKSILMHREIMQVPKGLLTDHKNHKGYDNRRCNLRICSRIQNQWNRAIQKSLSKYKGVYKDTTRLKWQCQIRCKGKRYYLGAFDSEIKAARIYDKKALELFGEFANTNF